MSCDVRWNVPRRLALTVAHVLAKGEPPLLRLKAARGAISAAAFNRAHADLVESSQCACCALADGTELVFIPVHNRSPAGEATRRTHVRWGARC